MKPLVSSGTIRGTLDENTTKRPSSLSESGQAWVLPYDQVSS